MSTSKRCVSVLWLALLNRCRGSVRFLELLSAFIAAHLNRLAADFDLNCSAIQNAVTSRASFCSHGLFSLPEIRVGTVSHRGEEGRYQNI